MLQPRVARDVARLLSEHGERQRARGLVATKTDISFMTTSLADTRLTSYADRYALNGAVGVRMSW